jgi:hypothetical protein
MGSPNGDRGRDQLATRERQAGPCGVTERSVVLKKLGNARAAYMEAIMDWWLHFRTSEALLEWTNLLERQSIAAPEIFKSLWASGVPLSSRPLAPHCVVCPREHPIEIRCRADQRQVSKCLGEVP